MPPTSPIHLKRIYDPPTPADGLRVFVDRLWPRGLKKENARLDAWIKDLAPSPELRKWFDHDPDKFEEFSRRYKKELAAKASHADELLSLAAGRTLTLLFAANDETHNHAVVLKQWLERRAKSRS